MSESYSRPVGYEQAVGQLLARAGMRVENMGGGCPFQADGVTPDGDAFYFRYRHDVAAIYIYAPGADWCRETKEYAELCTNSGYDGDLAWDEAIDLMERLWRERRPMSEVESTTVSRLRDAVEYMMRNYRARKEESQES